MKFMAESGCAGTGFGWVISGKIKFMTENGVALKKEEVIMDERVKQEYHRIYSELYFITLLICCISVVVKVMFFHKGVADCWLEYIVLVGSPVYRFIRCRMLHVTAPVIERKTWAIRLVACLATVSIIYGMVTYVRTGTFHLLEMLTFLVPFLVVFLIVCFGTVYVQKRWQKKMEDKYGE